MFSVRLISVLPVVWLAVTAGHAAEFPSVAGPAQIVLDGVPAPVAAASPSGFSVVAAPEGPQLALFGGSVLAGVQQGEQVDIGIPLTAVPGEFTLAAEVTLVSGSGAEVELALDGTEPCRAALDGKAVRLTVTANANGTPATARLRTVCRGARAAVQWDALQVIAGADANALPVAPTVVDQQACPPPVLPELRPAIEQALIEWDWRMQDGIGTPRFPVTHAEAVGKMFQRGDRLLAHLMAGGVSLEKESTAWERLRRGFDRLRAGEDVAPGEWEALWREVHVLRRRIVFRNPLARTGPLVFVKKAPTIFSHQITQYQGSTSRPGGGVFVLEKPGRSMRCRQLASELPMGSFLQADVSYDGRRVLFAHCAVEKTPPNRESHLNHFYHIYEIDADGSGLCQLTDGPFDDITPRYLPDGRIIFVSTRRGGFHRCGLGPCPTHTLALAEADGSAPRTISYHETHEWDPAVLHDGRVIYTRWDYIDRDAKYYQQLWSVRPDGSGVRIVYGNNTFNPVGIWEARAVPGSHRVIATAAAHHAMTAGSIILVDAGRGVDGLEPITRLTPDALFPESETQVIPGWRAADGVPHPPPVPVETQRWPGHSYRSPYALSEDLFLAAYSFAPLIGEPHPNRPNMFGLYLVDRFGNKELLYRDVSISSLWPVPLRPRRRPPVIPSPRPPDAASEGTFLLQNVYAAWPLMPKEEIRHLRIVQVLPKTTPHVDRPAMGLAHAAPGKQVLGTVPVEPDGSAHFTTPAGVSLAFQALDAQGRAVQTMRSEVYLQPGETASCIGCHELRGAAPPAAALPLAARRPPSRIAAGPDGSKPFSYPILVQPVLDKYCVRCHNPEKPGGKVVLTGTPQGHYTVSYNALAPRVPFSHWSAPARNSEPTTQPGRFGARASKLMTSLLEGHHKVKLSAEEIERLVTWMDANALFYGTFDPADQARQQRGERIEGPKLE